jgi:putative hydrolase of the HAD superfamily
MSAPRPRVQAVVFDLLYTLVHPGTYPGGVGRVAWLAQILGVAEPALRARWEEFESALEAGRVRQTSDGLGPELAWVKAVAADLGARISADDLARVDAGWDMTRRVALLNPPADTTCVLKALRASRIKLGLLSNAHALELQSWRQSPLAPFFDVAAFSYQIGACKPDPATYAHVLDRLKVPAAAAAYVGDGSYNELAGAKAAGFGLVVLAEQASAKAAPDDLPRLRAQADTSVSSLVGLTRLINSPG